MKKEFKIYLFKDKEDYIKVITEDNIYNITGEKGSGKSYFGNMKDNDEKCAVIHLDPTFTPEGSKYHDYSSKIRKRLIDKYGEDLNPYKSFESEYYDEIIEFLKSINKESYIEGGSISEIQNISKIVGTIVVKRTGVLKCFLRVLKRDYHNDYFMKISIEKHGRLGKIYRFKDVIKRRKKIFTSYHQIEDFIERIENYNK
ncbi:MAG: hypothetical protein V8R01_07205 [Bacilli bacterium]